MQLREILKPVLLGIFVWLSVCMSISVWLLVTSMLLERETFEEVFKHAPTNDKRYVCHAPEVDAYGEYVVTGAIVHDYKGSRGEIPVVSRPCVFSEFLGEQMVDVPRAFAFFTSVAFLSTIYYAFLFIHADTTVRFICWLFFSPLFYILISVGIFVISKKRHYRKNKSKRFD